MGQHVNFRVWFVGGWVSGGLLLRQKQPVGLVGCMHRTTGLHRVPPPADPAADARTMPGMTSTKAPRQRHHHPHSSTHVSAPAPRRWCPPASRCPQRAALGHSPCFPSRSRYGEAALLAGVHRCSPLAVHGAAAQGGVASRRPLRVRAGLWPCLRCKARTAAIHRCGGAVLSC